MKEFRWPHRPPPNQAPGERVAAALELILVEIHAISLSVSTIAAHQLGGLTPEETAQLQQKVAELRERSTALEQALQAQVPEPPA